MPLTNRRIVVTRSDSQQQGLVTHLQARGARVLSLPLLQVTPPDDWGPLDRALQELPQFQWLLLTSTNAVQYFWERLAHHGLGTSDLAPLKLAVVGEKTSLALLDHGLTPQVLPEHYDSEGLLTALAPLVWSGVGVLFPRVERGGREILALTLESWGAHVVQVAAYETRPPKHLAEEIHTAFRTGQVDLVTFTSSKTVRHFVPLVAGLDLGGASFAAIGPQTALTCRELLGRVEIVAQTYTLEGLVLAIESYFRAVSSQA
ncbi:uroporphyrinogen-III synthase [Candidatus Cyanaurora vandensis]|uniref:uroporphyrinogen-III synthase n=1 Tax=Candidatus Cyanaurora vandensis TaxID=2714958 RepID=UPI00257F8529|nr:uroporphyrinogen-III synthase [Candidatus Cyanaurora vandensis]